MPPKKTQSARKAGTAKADAQPQPKKGRKTLTFADSAAEEASKAVKTTHHVKFADSKRAAVEKPKSAAAATNQKKQQQRDGIVTAASVRKGSMKRAREEAAEEDDKDHEDAEVSSLVDDESGDSQSDNASATDDVESEGDLSELADSEGDSDGDEDEDGSGDDENPFAKAKRTGGKLAYKVLRLRFLPQEFQEPQLFKFLGQFGAEVLNCFCVRSRRTHQSKGIAYVQFDREEVLPLVLEECNGMALGGRAIRARIVTLRRAMPSKEKVSKRRRLAYAYSTKGAPLKQHNVLGKSPVALLIKAARTELSNNTHLKSLGIDYETHFFTEQLKQVPASCITKNTKVLVEAAAAAAAATEKKVVASVSPKKKAAKPAAATSKTSAKASAKKAATPPPRATGKKTTPSKKRGRASV